MSDPSATRPAPDRPIVTAQQYFLEQQQHFADATGEFSWLLSGITLATKMIQAKIRRAGLTDILGTEGAGVLRSGELAKLTPTIDWKARSRDATSSRPTSRRAPPLLRAALPGVS